MPIDPYLFLAFLGAAWVLILTPGPDMVFVVGQTLAGGSRRGWAALLGIVTGAMAHIVAAASGVAALLAAFPGLFDTLCIAGAVYLLWFSIGAFHAAWNGRLVINAAAPARKAYRDGLVTNLTNPKVALFFLTFLPQFVDPSLAPAWLQMLILGPLVPLMSIPVFAALIASADRAGERLARAARWLDGLAGTLFLALGLRLLFASKPA